MKHQLIRSISHRAQLNTLTAAFAFSLGILPPAANSATIQVPADQPTIQAAINSATSGDSILVSPGIYLENLDY